ncbi:MAG: hypothetical protein NVS9B10_04820 [Nevskia sp.]
MSELTVTRPIRWETWELSADSDRRFRRIVTVVAVPITLLAILIQLWHFAEPKRDEGRFDSTQYVQLLPEQAELAPKPEEPKPAEQNSKETPQEAKPVKPEVKPEKKPTPAPPTPTKSARDVASKSGVLEFADQLADLRDQNLSAITSPQTLNSAITSKGGIGAASGGAADSVAASAASGSGGIGGSGNAAVTTTQNGTGLGTRRTGAVKSPLGSGTDKRAGAGDRPPSGRTPSEIQEVMNKNQGPFYAIYNRAARENPNIGRGKIVVHLTVTPSGAVSACTLVSSSYNDAEFERKVIERLKLVNFGAKSVPDFSMDYPISFIPQ